MFISPDNDKVSERVRAYYEYEYTNVNVCRSQIRAALTFYLPACPGRAVPAGTGHTNGTIRITICDLIGGYRIIHGASARLLLAYCRIFTRSTRSIGPRMTLSCKTLISACMQVHLSSSGGAGLGSPDFA